jgi:hypothetical protein
MNSTNALTSPRPAYTPTAKPAAQGPAADSGDNRGELNQISIEPTENGFEVTCTYDSADDSKMSFESAAPAIAYVTKMMNGQSADESSDTDADDASQGDDSESGSGY